MRAKPLDNCGFYAREEGNRMASGLLLLKVIRPRVTKVDKALREKWE